MSIPEIDVAKRTISEVIALLQKSNDPITPTMQDHLSRMSGWYGTKENLYAIGQLCDPKILGDRFIDGMTYDQWLSIVARMKEDCAVAFKILEQLPANQKDGV